MNINFKKVASVLASAAMMGSTMGFAAAVTYPAPFVSGNNADVAIVVGSSAAATDMAAAADLGRSLASDLSPSGSSAGSTPEGGDFVMLDKSSDHLNIGDAITAPLGATIDDTELSELLADGTYTADDNDDFSYEQKITLGSFVLSHFQDSDYEDLIGANEDTPVVGINISSGDLVLNYTINFLEQAESDVSSSDLEDFEGSDITLLGKPYYISDAKNGSSSTYLGKITLLDSADSATVSEGESVTLNAGGKSYDVSISFVDNNSAKLIVNGETTDDLAAGGTQKLSDGSYVGIREVTKLEVSGTTGTVEFSIGSGKLELTSGSEVKISDETINGVRAYVTRGTAGSTGSEKIDEITINWVADDDMFITPESELELPGFGGVKFSMNELVRNDEEKVALEPKGNDKMELMIPIVDGDAKFSILYANSTGEFSGIGESNTKRLATSNTGTLTFYNKVGNSDHHEWTVVSYNTTDDAESYLLSFDVEQDTTAGRNETTIKNEVTGESLTERAEGDVVRFGDVSFTIADINWTSSEESVVLTAGSNVNFNTVFSESGLKVYLPWNSSAVAGADTSKGAINFTVADDILVNTTSSTAGHSPASFYVFMEGEDKDDNIGSGEAFNFTVDDDSDGKLEITQVNNVANGGPGGLERGDTDVFEYYPRDDVSPLIVHVVQTSGQDEAEVYYPMGDSETYAEVFLTSTSASTGTGNGNILPIEDNEVSSANNKNLIVVGGSCVNTVAATLLGSNSPLCEDDFTSETGVSDGEWLIETFRNSAVTSKLATLVAGYNAEDTVNAVNALKTSSVDISDGKKYTGDTSSGPTAA